MPDLAFRLEQPMAVDPFEGGFIIAWAAQGDGSQVALVFDPSAADETGRRLRELARREAGAPMPAGHVVDVQIHPPTSAAEPADLTLVLSDGRSITLTLPLDQLAGLSQTAAAALAVVEPAGQG